MKQSDAYKLLAAFMILIMIVVPLAYMVIDRGDITQPTPEPTPQENNYHQEYWVINQPFYSISDALNMTPYGAVTAYYVDITGMTPQMEQWARQGVPFINEADSIYKSNSTKVYYSNLQLGENSSFLLLNTMDPEKEDFQYIVLPISGIPILKRTVQDVNGKPLDIYNIMGEPVIFAPPPTAVDVLNIIYGQNKTKTAYDQYAGLLNNVEPAPFQIINSSVSFASQFYMGIAPVNGTYERTTAYLNINQSNFTMLDKLRLNSTQRSFSEYNITRSGNYTVVKIDSPSLLNVLKEEYS